MLNFKGLTKKQVSTFKKEFNEMLDAVREGNDVVWRVEKPNNEDNNK
jgi:hypothetical protein